MHDAPRIIDANANRAREALRVMEDVARFALDDAELCERLKTMRHELRSALGPVDRGRLLANRDIDADVGTTISTPSEGSRRGLRDVACAAAARLTESLRVIEECLKIGTEMGADRPAAMIERLRYEAYSVERPLILALGSGRARQWRLCVLLTESLCVHQKWEAVAEASIAGGADCIQLREKTAEAGDLLARARRLVAMARSAGAGGPDVVVNDRPDIALLAGADGVHLGQSDLSVIEARRIVGFDLLIGVSTADLDQAGRAVRDGADYCGVGPMFQTGTKPAVRVRGPEYLTDYLADHRLRDCPHLAIGGIDPGNAGCLAERGCRGVAVSSCVCGSRDPSQVCRDLLRALSPAASVGT